MNDINKQLKGLGKPKRGLNQPLRGLVGPPCILLISSWISPGPCLKSRMKSTLLLIFWFTHFARRGSRKNARIQLLYAERPLLTFGCKIVFILIITSLSIWFSLLRVTVEDRVFFLRRMSHYEKWLLMIFLFSHRSAELLACNWAGVVKQKPPGKSYT